jgi:hypothetical protein
LDCLARVIELVMSMHENCWGQWYFVASAEIFGDLIIMPRPTIITGPNKSRGFRDNFGAFGGKLRKLMMQSPQSIRESFERPTPNWCFGDSMVAIDCTANIANVGEFNGLPF